jgi:hypothetical protein
MLVKQRGLVGKLSVVLETKMIYAVCYAAWAFRSIRPQETGVPSPDARVRRGMPKRAARKPTAWIRV